MPRKKTKKVVTIPEYLPNKALIWLRTYAGLTQKEAAALVGERQSTYARWERGRYATKKGTISKLSRAIGFDPQYIPARIMLNAKPEEVVEEPPKPVASLEDKYSRYQLAWIESLSGVDRNVAAELLNVEPEAYARWTRVNVTIPKEIPAKLAGMLGVPMDAIPPYNPQPELGFPSHPFPGSLRSIVLWLGIYAEHYSPDYDSMTVRELIERLESQLQPLPGYPVV